MSVWIIMESGMEAFTIVVCPLNQTYPRYLVRFDRVITILEYEETCAFDRGYRFLPGWTKGVAAYQWIDSPWMQAYRGAVEVSGWKELHHYLILGDDSLVEVISSGEARIERVDTKRVIEVRHEV